MPSLAELPLHSSQVPFFGGLPLPRGLGPLEHEAPDRLLDPGPVDLLPVRQALLYGLAGEVQHLAT